MKRETVFSPCRKYRYSLWRQWDKSNPSFALFIGLNPSTADEVNDDPTLRRCLAFARKWGHGGLCLVNLFAFRAASPAVMQQQADPVGPKNDTWIALWGKKANRVVACWGIHGSFAERDKEVIPFLGKEIYCMGRTKSGQPRHPLYLKASQRLQKFQPGQDGFQKK
ncbi:MAG: DUF1643 domain-containing protein [Gemmataceae bacterium]|nr:DUF1643 domain-containing protein [Gemmataceae bacterium]